MLAGIASVAGWVAFCLLPIAALGLLLGLLRPSWALAGGVRSRGRVLRLYGGAVLAGWLGMMTLWAPAPLGGGGEVPPGASLVVGKPEDPAERQPIFDDGEDGEPRETAREGERAAEPEGGEGNREAPAGFAPPVEKVVRRALAIMHAANEATRSLIATGTLASQGRVAKGEVRLAAQRTKAAYHRAIAEFGELASNLPSLPPELTTLLGRSLLAYQESCVLGGEACDSFVLWLESPIPLQYDLFLGKLEGARGAMANGARHLLLAMRRAGVAETAFGEEAE